MITSRKMKQKYDQVDNKNIREDFDPINPSKDVHEDRMDEISRLIRNITNKMSRFERIMAMLIKSLKKEG
jgi:hypothetical protein